MVALQYWWLQTLLHTDWTSFMLLMSLTDLPKDIYDYVHRIGRTGRAGKSGLATAFFCTKNLPLAKALVELMQESNQEVPSWLKQHAERSTSVGQGKCYWASKFGGFDYRNAQSGRENYNYSSNYEGPDSLLMLLLVPLMVLLMLVLLVVVNVMLLQTQIHMPLVVIYAMLLQGHESIVATGWD